MDYGIQAHCAFADEGADEGAEEEEGNSKTETHSFQSRRLPIQADQESQPGFSEHDQPGIREPPPLLRSVDWDEPEEDVKLRIMGELPSLKSCLLLPETSVRSSHQRQIREAVGLQVLHHIPYELLFLIIRQIIVCQMMFFQTQC